MLKYILICILWPKALMFETQYWKILWSAEPVQNPKALLSDRNLYSAHFRHFWEPIWYSSISEPVILEDTVFGLITFHRYWIIYFAALIIILPVLKVNSNDSRHFQTLVGVKCTLCRCVRLEPSPLHFLHSSHELALY